MNHLHEPGTSQKPVKKKQSGTPLIKVIIILALLALVLGAALLIVGGMNMPAPQPEQPPVVTEPEPEPLPEPDPIYHPLTGQQIAEEAAGRLLCVSVDNSPEARPQSGVEAASLVYELPAEGNIPRLLLCYYDVNADKIGPVRSARPYIVNTARGWDGFFAHCGWSPGAKDLLYSGVVDYVNEISYSDYFWRDNDRYAPHNLYTSTARLYEALADRDLGLEQELAAFSFRREGEELAGAEQVERLRLGFDGANTIYQYDPARRAYGRYIGENAYIDGETGRQIYAANIIVQKVSARVIDSEGRLEIDLTGGGEALLFSGGQLLVGTWSRGSLDANTKFVDSSGQEFTLIPGQTWIELVDGYTECEYTVIEPEPEPEAGGEEGEA